MLAVNVGGQCGWPILAVNVDGQCGCSVLRISVGGQFWSLCVVSVGGRCR